MKHHILLHKTFVSNHTSYRVPYSLVPAVKEHIEKLIKLKIIRKSNSSVSSPAFVIRKKNGDIRLVTDYRKLNECTEKSVYPHPSISDCLMQLEGAKIFSTIDFNSGYYQILMAEDSIPYTAFSICNEQYEFLRMPFGLTNAPKTFQKAMNRIFGHLPYIKIYLDDLLIHSTNYQNTLST